MSRGKSKGLMKFTVIWFGQVVSLLGTGMTGFALTIWAWQLTGQATALALVGFFRFFPQVIMTPIAGALVDRCNRKLLMILSDLAAGVATIAIFILYRTESLEIWHLYVTAAFAGTFGAFQFPAYSASISLMLPKSQYTRASAMLGLVQSISTVFAPIAAGALLAFIGIGGILTIDIATFLFAIGTLLVVSIPQPEATHVEQARRGKFLSDVFFGFDYIFARPSLFGLLLFFLLVNMLLSFSGGVLSPMILARTGDNELILGTVQMLFGIGGVAGGALVSIWGGPKRRILGLIGGVLVSTFIGNVLLGIGQSLVVWSVGAIAAVLFIPLASGASQSIWQSKVSPHLQGRVFSARIVIGQIGGAIALPLAGLLADHVFEPLMIGTSPLAAALSHVVGSGRGAGMGLMFVLFGILGGLATIAAYRFRPIREIETILPDHDEAPSEEATPDADAAAKAA